jgi:hypothetical protein
MLPAFLVEEAIVRESGESAPVFIGEQGRDGLLITLGITHSLEHQSLNVEILSSSDGESWMPVLPAAFHRKMYCGTYQVKVQIPGARFLRASWTLDHRGRGGRSPFCRFYLVAQEALVRAMAGAA